MEDRSPAQPVPQPSRFATFAREIAAFIVVPFVALAVIMAGFAILRGPVHGQMMDQSFGDLTNILWFLAIRVPIAHFAAIVIGVPAHGTLLLRRKTRFWHYLLSGVVLAAGICTVGWFALRFFQSTGYDFGLLLSVSAIAGLTAAAVFWFIVFWRNSWYARGQAELMAAGG